MRAPILIVEDDLVLQVTLKKVLENVGYSVLVAHNITEAHEQLAAAPGIILLDLGLPDGNGFELLEQTTIIEDCVTIVTTGSTSVDAVVQALRLGAFDYLIKPVNRELLLQTIERAHGYSRLHRIEREMERLRAHDEAMLTTARTAAHYLSQNLTVILGEAQLLQEDNNDEVAREGLQRIVNAVEKAAQTLEQLRQVRHFVTQDLLSAEPILDLEASRIK